MTLLRPRTKRRVAGDALPGLVAKDRGCPRVRFVDDSTQALQVSLVQGRALEEIARAFQCLEQFWTLMFLDPALRDRRAEQACDFQACRVGAHRVA